MADEPRFLYLTTTGRTSGLPREIEIWFTERDGRYYVIAETGEDAHWVRNILANPSVAFSVGDSDVWGAFQGSARVVRADEEPELHAAVQALSRDKYGWGEGLVVELEPKRHVVV